MSDASSASSSRPLCGVCNHRLSIYTCPRCSVKTCSLPCSTTHKAGNHCTGERDKATYVPMNEYGWGTMMDDYTFLEDISRRVGDWGSEITREGYAANATLRGRGRGRGASSRGRGRGRGGNYAQEGPNRTKRDSLKAELDRYDIDMDLLPNGMQKRKNNMSTWDTKNNTALLTIQFDFQCPPDPYAPSTQTVNPPFTILSHRNNIQSPLILLAQNAIAERRNPKRDSACPLWATSLISPDSDDPEAFTHPHFVMAAQVEPGMLTPSNRRVNGNVGFYKLDSSRPLSEALRKTHFVEYPTIQIWEEFRGVIIDTQGTVPTVTSVEDLEKPAKRRKLDVKAGKKAISGLLGDYGSDDDDSGRETDMKPPGKVGGLSALGGYVESDGEDEMQAELDVEDLGSDAEEESVLTLDAASLLKLIQETRGGVQWNTAAHEDAVDWGDSGGEEDSA